MISFDTIQVIAAGVLLLTLPGMAVQTFVPLPSMHWSVRLAVAIGISLSLLPLMLIVSHLFGFRFDSIKAWLLLVISALVLLAKFGRQFKRILLSMRGFRGTLQLSDLVLSALLLVVAVTRLFVLSELHAPMWGDSVQHSMISQLIFDNGGIFSSWLPYAPYSTFTVHMGFHVFTAFTMMLSGSDVVMTTLVAGQLLNIAAVIVMLPLARIASTSSWAGVGVVLVVGLLSPLPAGYVNWGRYAQLAGQVVLPVAMWMIWRIIQERGSSSWHFSVLVGLVLAGMFMNYYRTPHYVALFLFAALIIKPADGWLSRQEWARLLLRGSFAAVTAAILLLPWLLRLQGGALAEGNDPAQSQGINATLTDFAGIRFIAAELLHPLIIVFAVVSASWVIVRRDSKFGVFVIWLVLLIALPFARLLPLPGVNNLQSFAVLISLYIPLGLLAGHGIDALLTHSQKSRHASTAVLVGLVVLSLMGAQSRIAVVDASYQMLMPSDQRAMQWIQEHIPVDALFVVDGFQIYDGRSAVGSDGGWWIPLLTQRRTTMPPQYPLLAEKPIDPAYNEMVVRLTREIRQHGIASSDAIAMLCQYGVTHAYIGQVEGRVGTPPPTPMLSREALDELPAFVRIYAEERVAIFALRPEACH